MKHKLLKSLLLLCALVGGMSTAWADEGDEITSIANIVDGKSYYIKGVRSSTTYYLSFTDAVGSQSGTESSTKAGAQLITFHLVSSGVYTLETSTGKFIAPGTSNGKIAVSASGVNVTASNQSSYIRLSITSGSDTWSIQKNKSAANFGGYKNTQNDITLIEGPSSYSVTAVSNNDSWGTVSGTKTITASPSPGYRVANGSDGYTVTSGTATVSHEGYSNTLTVTPTSDCTVRVNFEAIPSHTLNSAVSPAASGTVTLGSATVAEGATTTATAAAAAGYKFTGWSITGTGASLSSTSTNPTTVTMGTADATITATFEAVTTYAIRYSVNGSVVRTVNVEEDAAIDLSAPASGVPAGYYFKGWRTSTLAVTDTDPDDYVTSATSTADITYYAVMAVKTASAADTYTKLENNSFDAAATYVIGGLQGGSGDGSDTMWYLYSYSSVDEDINWGTCTSSPSTNAPVTFKLSGTAAALVAKDNSNNYLTCISAKKFAMSSTSTTVYLHTDGSIKSASDGNLLRYNYNSGSGGLRWYASTTGTQAYFYKVIDNCTYGNYCTTVPTATITLATACTEGGKFYGTYSNSSAFVVPADLTVSTASVSAGALVLTNYATGDVVKANTGVLVSSTTSGDHTISLAAGGTEKDGNMLKASSVAMTGSNLFYRLTMHNGTTLGFYWGAASGAAFDLAANKAYLAVPTASPVKEFYGFDFDETPDGINQVNGSEFMVNGPVYDLQGRRVLKPGKGLYIVNGKKVLF